MSQSNLSLVDLGCGLGNHIGEFIKTGHHFFEDPYIRVIEPGKCLGIDTDERFKRDLTERGYQFLTMRFADSDELMGIPAADYFLIWDFLDRMPTREWADTLVMAAIHRARKGVMLRLNSFEQDLATGEGKLKDMGLRFAWTKDPTRPTHYLMNDAVNAVHEYRRRAARNSVTVRFLPGKRIRTTDDLCVVPEAARPEDKQYLARHGSKPSHPLVPSLVAQWEVIITP